ncbi:hypothetical protein [Vibrio maritimus]|uniref:hypothetical protein n=1 Tax=Vibrio maritimus TaxID=990268 RepID=UPI00373690D5
MSTYLNILSAEPELMSKLTRSPLLDLSTAIELTPLDGRPTYAFYGDKIENHSSLERLSREQPGEGIYYRYTNTELNGADSGLVNYREGITRVLLKYLNDQSDSLSYQRELLDETQAIIPIPK